MSVHTSSWYATTTTKCPTGDPGVYVGEVSSTRFPVIRDADGLLWFQHTTGVSRLQWSPMRGWDRDRFVEDLDEPEWKAECTHGGDCYTERDCDALKVEQGSEDW